MAKLRMTYKNLKALRKSKEYQAVIVDLVATDVLSKSKAEELLGYNIPANLIGGDDSTEEEETGGGSDGEESVVTPGKVTLVYFDTTQNEWKTAEYTITGEDTVETVLTAAKTAFSNDSLNAMDFLELNSEYVEGTSGIGEMYNSIDPQPETFAIKDGDIIGVHVKAQSAMPTTPGPQTVG